MKLKFILLMKFILILVCTLSFAQKKSDRDIITERMVADLHAEVNITDLDREISNVLSTMSDDGSWPDINYRTSGPASEWPPSWHFKRLQKLVEGYYNQKSSYYAKNELFTKIQNSFTFWVSLSPAPSASNWWYRGVGIPLHVGRSLMMLQKAPKDLPSDLKEKLYPWIDNNGKMYGFKTAKSGDANASDYSKILIMIGCLKNLPAIIKQGVGLISSAIYIDAPNSDGGLLPDKSIMFHGNFLYMEGYGTVFLNNATKLAIIMQGTAYQFSSDRIAVLSTIARDGYLKTIRGRFSDFNIWGRGISRKGSKYASHFF